VPPQERVSAKAFRALVAKKGPQRPWSNAKRSTCLSGHRHPSKLEQRTCDGLRLQYGEPGGDEFVTVHTSMPLLSMMRKGPCKIESASVDFVVWRQEEGCDPPWYVVRLIEAKGRASREWKRTKAALESSYGIPVEVITQ
jgi:hypothetical protein